LVTGWAWFDHTGHIGGGGGLPVPQLAEPGPGRGLFILHRSFGKIGV